MAYQQQNTNAARLLLEHYGFDSLSYFALHEKKKYFFSSTGRSFLSYTTEYKVALVSGDPIGPEEDMQVLLKEFNYFTKGAQLTTCFVGVHEKSLASLSRGHHILHAGDEAIISLPKFDKTILKKKVRRAEKHVAHLGITAHVYTRENLPTAYLQQIQTISQEWIQFKGGKERGFTMTLGRIPDALDKDCEFVIALHNKTVLGYLTLVPIYASQGLSLDTSRRKIDAPNGLTEFLLMQAFEHYKAQNKQQISLNFATFYRHFPKANFALHKVVKRIIYTGLSHVYKTNKLYTFNEKFMPEWQSRYIAFEKKRYIPSYVMAIAKTELNI